MIRSFTAVLFVACLASASPAQIGLEDQEVAGSGPGAHHRFGTAIAAEGDTLVVGAPEATLAHTASGFVEIFERDASGTWISQAVLAGTASQTLARFGGSLALSGDLLAISYQTVPLVEIYQRDSNGVFNLLQVIQSPGTGLVGFGRLVALENGRLAVASNFSLFFGPAAVSIFELAANGMFDFVTTVSVGPGGSNSISSIGISGDVIVAGQAAAPSGPLSNAGRALVFVRNANGTWLLDQTLTPEPPVAGEFFGSGVAVAGDRLVVGRPGAGGGAGRVSVFERSGSGPFVKVVEFASANPGPTEGLGSTIALRGERMVVGAPKFSTDVTVAGALYLFERTSSGQWLERVRLGRSDPDPNEGLGGDPQSIVLLDEVIVSGSQRHNSILGAVQFHDIGKLYHGVGSISLAAGGAQSLLLRGGAALGGDVFLLLGSVSGTSPAIPLAPGVELPLVFDAYTSLGLSFSTPAQPGFGVLDALGHANAAFTVPAGANASLAGVVIHHAYLTIDLVTSALDASNAVSVELTP